jgi:hypothetical protein
MEEKEPTFELKPLSSEEAVHGALAKAERYRLLNEAWEAESICLDVLRIDPHNQDALRTLLLAITDQFDEHGVSGNLARAHEVLPLLTDEYDRHYFMGIVCERRAKAHLKLNGPRADFLAYDWLRAAMRNYEAAEAIRPPDNDDAILRWNACARVLMRNPNLRAAAEVEGEPLMLE